MKTLSNTVGDRINIFDNAEHQTVQVFNDLFVECPIRDKDLTLSVEILGPDVNNCRTLKVGDETLTHKMYSDILYTLDRSEYHLDEREIELDEINGVPV